MYILIYPNHFPTFYSHISTTFATLATILATCWSMLTKVWTLNIWLWLLLYPSVTRKALQTFDCIELLGEFYLRADPAVHCSGDVWWLMAVLASVGVFVTCILAPIALVTQMALTLTSIPTLTLTSSRQAGLAVRGPGGRHREDHRARPMDGGAVLGLLRG